MNRLTYLLRAIIEMKLSPTDECVEWPHARHANGYGIVHFNGRNRLVTRVAHELYYGSSPNGCVLHICDNPPCFNLSHLYVGTRKQNYIDAVTRGLTQIGIHKGEEISTSKLTDNDVANILNRLKAGETVRDIAEDYPVSYQAIGQIKKGQAWKHIPRP
jgi:hypothetical protein